MLSKNDKILDELLTAMGAKFEHPREEVIRLALKKGESPDYARFLADEHSRLRQLKLLTGLR